MKKDKIDIETLASLNESGASISVTVCLDDLMRLFEHVATKGADDSNKGSDLVPQAKVEEQFNVSRSTLKRWKDAGYLKPVKIGGKNFYHQADVDRISK